MHDLSNPGVAITDCDMKACPEGQRQEGPFRGGR